MTIAIQYTQWQAILQLIAVLPTLRFSRGFGLVFLWICVFFEDLGVACFWAYFDQNLLVFWACFLQISVMRIAFFQILWPVCSFNLLQNELWACLCANLLILGFFSDLPPCFCI